MITLTEGDMICLRLSLVVLSVMVGYSAIASAQTLEETVSFLLYGQKDAYKTPQIRNFLCPECKASFEVMDRESCKIKLVNTSFDPFRSIADPAPSPATTISQYCVIEHIYDFSAIVPDTGSVSYDNSGGGVGSYVLTAKGDGNAYLRKERCHFMGFKDRDYVGCYDADRHILSRAGFNECIEQGAVSEDGPSSEISLRLRDDDVDRMIKAYNYLYQSYCSGASSAF